MLRRTRVTAESGHLSLLEEESVPVTGAAFAGRQGTPVAGRPRKGMPEVLSLDNGYFGESVIGKAPRRDVVLLRPDGRRRVEPRTRLPAHGGRASAVGVPGVLKAGLRRPVTDESQVAGKAWPRRYGLFLSMDGPSEFVNREGVRHLLQHGDS